MAALLLLRWYPVMLVSLLIITKSILMICLSYVPGSLLFRPIPVAEGATRGCGPCPRGRIDTIYAGNPVLGHDSGEICHGSGKYSGLVR